MPLGKRQLFVYWRVAADDLAPALRAARDWQRSLHAAHPLLDMRLYLRADAGGGDATVMESYALDTPNPSSGVGAALQCRIEDEGTATLQRWLRGARHVEVFDALDDEPSDAPAAT